MNAATRYLCERLIAIKDSYMLANRAGCYGHDPEARQIEALLRQQIKDGDEERRHIHAALAFPLAKVHTVEEPI